MGEKLEDSLYDSINGIRFDDTIKKSSSRLLEDLKFKLDHSLRDSLWLSSSDSLKDSIAWRPERVEPR